MRIRPFVFYGTETCNTKDQENNINEWILSVRSYLYRLGNGTGVGGSETQTGDAILERGYQFRTEPRICGYHWQSDVDAGALSVQAALSRHYTLIRHFRAQLAKPNRNLHKKIGLQKKR